MNCPICAVELKKLLVGTIEVDVCHDHGVWMDQGALLGITEKDRHESSSFKFADLWRAEKRPPVDESRTLFCPVTGDPMKIEFYEGVHMDWSPGHGIWLDKGELGAILNNLRLTPTYAGKAALRLWDDKY
jgi:Zn-finger nucleic acid-binding protein